jgi:flagellar protein FlbD
VIRLTRLNDQSFAVNSDLIKLIEQAPDTVVSLTTGDKIVVRESSEEIIRRIVEFRRRIYQSLISCRAQAGSAIVTGEPAALTGEQGG